MTTSRNKDPRNYHRNVNLDVHSLSNWLCQDLELRNQWEREKFQNEIGGAPTAGAPTKSAENALAIGTAFAVPSVSRATLNIADIFVFSST